MKLNLIRGISITTVLAVSSYMVAMIAPTGLGQPGLGQPGLASSTTGSPAIAAVAPAHVASAGSTIMASAILSNGAQQVLIYDQSKSTIAVYHVNSSTGDIQLKSVRKIDADFALQEFNLSEPTPSTIRKNVK